MRSSKINKEEYAPEYGVDSRYSSQEDKLSDGQKLMEARLERMKGLSKGDVIKAKLVQLKLKMEDYLKEPVYKDYNFFTSFLSTYVDIIYDKRSTFAQDISISPVSLSQVLNKHREPKEEFMLRLMLHSELAFKGVCDFSKKTWYQVYYHEKICDTMANQDEWRPEETKHVNISNAVLS